MKARNTLLTCALMAAMAIPCVAFAATSASTPGSESAAKAEASASKDAMAAEKDAAGKDAIAKDAKDADEDATAAPSEELVAWAEDMTCSACHVDQAASAEEDGCLMATHAPLELDCIACHADDALIDVHADAKADAKLPTKLKKSDVPAAACGTCHQHDALVEATSDSDALTDADGNVANPHDLPAVKEHKSIDCDTCHKMHSPSSPKNVADELCVSCHHEDVYECYTCHA